MQNAVTAAGHAENEYLRRDPHLRDFRMQAAVGTNCSQTAQAVVDPVSGAPEPIRGQTRLPHQAVRQRLEPRAYALYVVRVERYPAQRFVHQLPGGWTILDGA